MKRQNTKIPVYDAEYIEHSSGPWRHKPKPQKRPISLSLYWCGLIAVLVTLMIAHAVVRSGIAGGW